MFRFSFLILGFCLFFCSCQEKEIDLDGIWVNELQDERYYFCADTFNYFGIGHEVHIFRIKNDKFIVQTNTPNQELECDFEIINNDSIRISRPNWEDSFLYRIKENNYINYQLAKKNLNIQMVVDSPTQVFDIITPHSFNIIIDNNHSLIDKPYIFLKHEKVTIDSLSIKMNQHINNTEERLRDRWMNETSLIIDKKISFEIYNHIRKQLLSINERNILFNKKISHIYKNNSKINSRLCIEKFTNHSIIKHKLLSSRIEQIELCRNWEVGFKENRDSINIKISEDNQILIDNKKVQDNHIISLLQFKYISKGKNIIFTISPSPKSTYGKYLFIRNRIKDCIDISKKEYMIEHFGRDSEDYPFSIEKWERDSLNKLFPLYEELGYF